MEKDEYKKIGIGELVYLFKLEISLHHHVNLGIAVELKKTGEDMFKVSRVICGKVLKVGEEIKIDDRWKSRYVCGNLFKSVEEGIEWWNSKIRNAEDGLTSDYERKKKSLNKRLITI